MGPGFSDKRNDSVFTFSPSQVHGFYYVRKRPSFHGSKRPKVDLPFLIYGVQIGV